MNKRLDFLDFLRGITLISMVLYHAAWDLQYMFGINIKGYEELPGAIWQKSICITFIALSGFVCFLGTDIKKTVKRGIIISICGLIVSFVTLAFIPENPISFGILTFIGFAMIVFSISKKYLVKVNCFAGFFVCICLYILLRRVNWGVVGLGNFSFLMPPLFYKNQFTAFLGFPNAEFMSVDYFPVLPWLFIYGAGFYLCGILNYFGITKRLTKPSNTFLNYIGKHTLPIYMVHQPLIYVILYAWFYIR